jgi:CRISPR-associated protein Csx17
VIVHELGGCAPTPLAHYLKALGILRLVAEQADPEARAWWKGERYFLASHLDQRELIDFFLERYSPTPLVSPWNKGSGFFYASDPALTPCEHSTAKRFEDLRAGIAADRKPLHALEQADRDVRRIKSEAKACCGLIEAFTAGKSNRAGWKRPLPWSIVSQLPPCRLMLHDIWHALPRQL